MRNARPPGRWPWLLLIAALAVAACGGTTTAPAAHPNRLPIAGSAVYANGVNLPWIRYGNDVGGNAWGEFGFHDDAATLNHSFATMQAQGVTTARVWVFADGRAGIDFNAAGLPVRLDPQVFGDLDTLTHAAAAHGVHLDLVLFDSVFMYAPEDLGDGVTSGGQGALIGTGAGAQALERVVIDPVLRHLARNRGVFSIEVMNEPESCIAQDGNLASRCVDSPVSLVDFNAWVRSIAAVVHRDDPGMLVTVGSASSHWVGQYAADGLDYFQVHSYGTVYAPDLSRTPASRLRLGKPIVIGEYGADPSASGFEGQLSAWYRQGYAGAWVWSFLGVDSVGTYDGPTMTTWNQAHPATRVG